MKVLLPFVGDTIGGSHHSAAILIRDLPRLGIDPVVVVHRNGPLKSYFVERGIPAKGATDLPVWESGLGPVANLMHLISVTPKLWLYLRRLDVDVVHVNDGRMAISWCLPCRLAGVPLVIHQRTRFAASRISALALGLAARILAISRYTQTSLPMSVRDRSRIVANPFDDVTVNRANARADVINELGLNASCSLLVYVGTLQAQKRPLVALRAFAALRAAGVNAVLLMAGRDGDSEAQAVHAFITGANLEKHVRVLGFRADAERLIASADVLVAPAVDEGHGRAVVEAMLLGTPVVAAGSGGHLETIEDRRTGVLVCPDDAQAFAHAIALILTNPDMSGAMATAARSEMTRRHGIDLHAKAVALAYRESIGRVALVIESMGGGGAQQVVGQLLTRWMDRGDVPVLITFQPPETDRIPVPAAVERYVIGGAGRSHGWWGAVVANLRRLLRLRRALRDAHIRTAVAFVTATNVLTVLAALGLGVRVVVSERNDPVRQSLGRAWALLRRLVYPLAWRVTANTKAALISMTAYIPLHRLVLVPNPLREDSGVPAECAEPPFVLAVGRLHHQKNYPGLLRAFAEADLQGWRIRILGDGPEREYIEALADQLGVSCRLDLPGYVRDPFPHYRAARVFVMISFYEGSPNALWEAMSCGLPTVISDSIVGALELVENGRHTLVVPAGDESALAATLEMLAKNGDLRQRIGQEAALFTRQFSIDSVLMMWNKAVFDRKSECPVFK